MLVGIIFGILGSFSHTQVVRRGEGSPREEGQYTSSSTRQGGTAGRHTLGCHNNRKRKAIPLGRVSLSKGTVKDRLILFPSSPSLGKRSWQGTGKARYRSTSQQLTVAIEQCFHPRNHYSLVNLPRTSCSL